MAINIGSMVTKVYGKFAKVGHKVTTQVLEEPVPKQPSVSDMGDHALDAAKAAVAGSGISAGGGSSVASGSKGKGGRGAGR